MTTEEMASELDCWAESCESIIGDKPIFGLVKSCVERLRELERVRAHYADHGNWFGASGCFTDIYQPKSHGWTVAEGAEQK